MLVAIRAVEQRSEMRVAARYFDIVTPVFIIADETACCGRLHGASCHIAEKRASERIGTFKKASGRDGYVRRVMFRTVENPFATDQHVF